MFLQVSFIWYHFLKGLVSCVSCLVVCVLCFVFCVLCFVFCFLCTVFCVSCLFFCVLCLLSCVLCFCVSCLVSCVLRFVRVLCFAFFFWSFVRLGCRVWGVWWLGFGVQGVWLPVKRDILGAPPPPGRVLLQRACSGNPLHKHIDS